MAWADPRLLDGGHLCSLDVYVSRVIPGGDIFVGKIISKNWGEGCWGMEAPTQVLRRYMRV